MTVGNIYPEITPSCYVDWINGPNEVGDKEDSDLNFDNFINYQNLETSIGNAYNLQYLNEMT